MYKYIYTLMIIILCSSCNSSIEHASKSLYKKVSFLNKKNDTIDINQVIGLYKNGQFNVPMQNKVFYKLKDKPATWFHFKIDNLNEDTFFSFWGAFLEYGKVYLYYNDTINEQKELSLINFIDYKSEYRFPTWKLKKTDLPTHVFVKIKDSKRVTSLKLLLFNSEEFIQFAQKDSTNIALIFSFFIVMLVAIACLFIVKKQYSLLWYAGYIVVFSFDLITNHGIDLQLQLFSTATEHSIKRLLFQSIGAVCIGMFYISFYPFTKETLYIKKAFKIVVGFYFFSVLIMISFIIFDTIYIPKIYFWFPQRILMLFVLLGHLILIRKKVIPFYLSLGFIATLLVYLRFLYDNPRLDLSLTHYFILDNLFYFAIAIETGFILFYIISQLVKSEFLAVHLKNENLTLRNSFQNNILKIQEQERNKLLSNVHDSFGGYLEALKIRLLHKTKNTPEKIQEILDSFYKEYRYLLNSLYSPKINSNNFTENLIGFFDKLNQLTNNSIVYQFNFEDTKMSPENCVHLYRIISELTTNAIKYAKASKINIEISKNKNQLFLNVFDNGVGFDEKTISINKYGLNGVKNRVGLMNGNVEILSTINKGTSIKISIPINE